MLDFFFFSLALGTLIFIQYNGFHLGGYSADSMPLIEKKTTDLKQNLCCSEHDETVRSSALLATVECWGPKELKRSSFDSVFKIFACLPFYH